MVNLPIYIEDIDFMDDGISISGEMEFPELFGFVRGSVSQIQITKSEGVDLIGNVSMDEMQANGFALRNMSFQFSTISNEFSGNGQIETSLFEAGANLRIIDSGIDEIGMFLSMNNSQPLGTTGLALSGLNGNINNIQIHPNPPMIIALGASLTPVGAPTDVVEFEDVSLSYQFGTSLSGSGTFTVLNTESANAGYEVREGLFKINAEINFYDIVNAVIEAGIADNQNNSIDVFARFYADLQLPDGDGFPYDWLDPFFDLPVTFTSFDNILYNNELSGKWVIDLPVFNTKFSYLLNYSEGALHKDFARNYSLFNEFVFTNTKRGSLKFNNPPKKYTDWNSPKYNRFEGRSLIINSKDYQNRKNRNDKLSQDFILSEVSESIVVRVVPEDISFTPNLVLIDPNGIEINQSNIDSFDSIMYSYNELNNAVFYTIKSAASGVWYILVDDEPKDQYVDVFGTNQDAEIIIDGVFQDGDEVTVTWMDENRDFDGQISLYYDYDDNGIDGNYIISGISEDDESDSYTFNISDLEPGAYYVYAIMFDENGTPASSYGAETFTKQCGISAPENLNYEIVAGNYIKLSWELIDDDYNYDYILYYNSEGQVNYSSLNLNAGNDVDSFVFTNTENQGAFQFMVVAQDENGIIGEASNTIEVDLSVYQMIELDMGWNLIGFSIKPYSMQINDVFEPISDYILLVKNEQESFDPTLPDFLNTLLEIENGKGYWVQLSQATQFVQNGQLISIDNIDIELKTGWNLVSIPIQYSMSIESVINPIAEKVIMVKSIQESYDPILPPYLNTLNHVFQDHGYWIKVSEDCILTF